MNIYKAYKFRIYPNNENKNKLNSYMGTSRFIYNYYLNIKDKMYKENNINYKLDEMKKDIKNLLEEYEWLKEIDSSILRTTLDDLDKAYINYYKKRSLYPKYKRKNNHDTFRTVAIRSRYKGKEYCNIKVDLEKRVIKLPKLEEIKIRGYRNLKRFEDKKILSVTVSKEANKYYASSQICNHCGNKEEKVKDLSIRKWECSKCHNINDRDINASINILMKGIERYYKEEYVM